MARYTTGDVLSTPPTMDDVHEALKHGTLHSSQEIKVCLQKFVNDPPMETFCFGPLDVDDIHDAQRDGTSFITNKCYTQPYKVCAYRSTIKYKNADIGVTLINVVDNEDGHNTIGTIRLLKAENGHVFAMFCVNTMNTKPMPEGMAVEFHVPRCDIQYWSPQFEDDKEMEWHCTEGGLLNMGFTMILNTKGVLKQRTAPPAKPNRARAAKGRPLLPYVTRVYTGLYNQAVAPGAPGTHASPRPHIRRAHIRHYPATATRQAYVLPIAAMLVNWDGTPMQPRAEYVVK